MMPITWKLEPAHILELLLESAPVGITVLTTDLKYVVVSRTVAEEFVQLPEKEILGRYCYDVIGTYRDDPDKEGPDRICDGCPALRCLSTGGKATGMRQIRPDLIIRDIAVPVREEGGEVVGVMECLENVADKVTDPLTKIRNYRYYDEMKIQESSRAKRYGNSLSLLALDLNHFKRVNDRFGHPQGDRVLREVAMSFDETVRDSDHLCRVGGDEFAVLAPHTGLWEAEALADRLTEVLADRFKAYGISLAVGVASYPEDTDDPTNLRELADRRLYRAKDARRNPRIR